MVKASRKSFLLCREDCSSRDGQGVDSMGTNHTIHRELDITTIQGVAVELRHILPEGWTMARESGSFILRGNMSDGVEESVWRIVRFVAYPEFLALQRVLKTEDKVQYEMISSTAGGHGFRIVFILTAPSPIPKAAQQAAAADAASRRS
jgi:hypothetical protein